MAILRGDATGARFSGGCVQHIVLERRQRVAYWSRSRLINYLVASGLMFNVTVDFRGISGVLFRSSGRVRV